MPTYRYASTASVDKRNNTLIQSIICVSSAFIRLFSLVVPPLVEMGQIPLEEQYIDVTKIESETNKYTLSGRSPLRGTRQSYDRGE